MHGGNQLVPELLLKPFNTLFVCLCWGLTSQSTIFQSCRDRHLILCLHNIDNLYICMFAWRSLMQKERSFWRNKSLVNLAIFSCLLEFVMFIIIAHTRGNQHIPELLLKLSVICIYNTDILSICTKTCRAKNKNKKHFSKKAAYQT